MQVFDILFKKTRLLFLSQNQQERSQVESMLGVFGQSTEYIVHLRVNYVKIMCVKFTSDSQCSDTVMWHAM